MNLCNNRIILLVFIRLHIDQNFIHINQDSTCRVWQNPVNVRDIEDALDIDCLACWEGHVGKNVWSLSICEEKGIVVSI